MAPFGASRAGLMSTRVDAIPDSEALYAHFDAMEIDASDQDSLSSWDDLAEGNNASATGSPTFEESGFNSKPSVLFDGVDDAFQSSTFSSIEHPYTVFHVIELDSGASPDNTIFSGREEGDGGLNETYWRGNWAVFSGDRLDGSSSDDVNLITSVYDENNSIIREDGSESGSGDAGSRSWDQHTIGRSGSGNDRFWDGRIMELLLYPDRRSASEIDEVETYLTDKWDL